MKDKMQPVNLHKSRVQWYTLHKFVWVPCNLGITFS